MLASGFGLVENGLGTTGTGATGEIGTTPMLEAAVGVGRGLVDDVAMVGVLAGGLEHGGRARREAGEGEMAAGVGGGGGVAGVEDAVVVEVEEDDPAGHAGLAGVGHAVGVEVEVDLAGDGDRG